MVDNGQIELTKILTSVFDTLYAHVEFRKVKPVDYKLFQAAESIYKKPKERMERDIADYAKDGRLTEPLDGKRYEWCKMIMSYASSFLLSGCML